MIARRDAPRADLLDHEFGGVCASPEPAQNASRRRCAAARVAMATKDCAYVPARGRALLERPAPRSAAGVNRRLVFAGATGNVDGSDDAENGDHELFHL